MVRQFFVCLSILASFAVAAKDPWAPLELLKVVVVNRHGHRSPNGDYWNLCPDDYYNREHYDVGNGMLTGIGFEEEENVGAFLRRVYGSFIGSTYDPSRHLMRATGDIRTMQSCMLVSEGVFPDGFGPRGFVPSRPQAVPVFSDLSGNDNLLTDAACFERSIIDKTAWMKTKGEEVLSDPFNKKLVAKLMMACGADPSIMFSADDSLKSIVDGLIFNSAYGEVPLHGEISPKELSELRNLSMALLIGKLFSTDEQRTYMASDLPYQMLMAFEAVAAQRRNGTIASDYIRFDMFTGHREMLYALEHFFGWTVDFGLAGGELPTATAFIVELLHDTHAFPGSAQFFVHVYAYSPGGKRGVRVPFCARGTMCTLDEYAAAYNDRVQRTGSWEELCGVNENGAE